MLDSSSGYPSLSTIWVSDDEMSAVLGSWNATILAIKKKDNIWETVTKTPIDSFGIYNQCYIPDIYALLLVGTKPYYFYLYNLDNEQILNFNFIPSCYETCQTIDNSTVALGGNGFVAIVKFSKDKATQKITFESYLLYNMNNLAYSAATYNSSKNVLAMATSSGKLVEYPQFLLKRAPIFKGTIE